TAAPNPGWGALAGLYLIDASNQSFLITGNTSNTLTLHHTVTPPANGGWRIVQPVHWGPASGGDVLNVEGADFPMTDMPHMRIGQMEARVMTYNSGHISVRTPPAPFDLPGTYEVSSVWLITAAGNTQPTPVEARAPRSEWFTYVMDGPPEIVEIEPNQIYVDTARVTEQMQDPTQYITITGYNFDDRVIVTFTFTDESSTNPTTVSVPLHHFSVSPNMIVIAAPDFMTLLDPLLHPEPDSTLDLLDNHTGTALPDGLPDPTSAGTHYEVSVTVTNYVDDSGDLPVGVVLGDSAVTSNPHSIFYVVDDRDLMTPSDADLLFNDVYLNYRDYVNVNPGTGSIAKDPMLLPEGAPASLPWWRGKLEVVGDGSPAGWGRNELNPMRDKAGKFIERPFTEADYELEARPDLGEPEHVQGTGRHSDEPRLPDIGADEILGGSGGGVMPYWYYAEVVPNPVPAMPARTLQVQVRFFGIVPEDIIYIVPQGVPFSPGFVDTSRSIAIELRDYGDGIYFGTNVNPIHTVVGDVNGTIPPTQGDYLNDGHAAIVVPVLAPAGLVYLGDTPHDLTDGGIIVEQAILGRHFLIDTVPPRPRLTVAPARPVNLMTLNNVPGLYAAQGVTLPGPGHPYGPVTGLWRPLTEPSPPGGPYDQLLDGIPTVLPVPPLRGGTQAFFNVGSISNGYIPENLNITIGFGDVLQANPDYTLAFIDEPPKDAVTGDFIQGNPEDRDYYSNEHTREASGFPLTPSGPVVQTDHTLPPTVALFSDSTYVPATGELRYEYRVSSQLPPYDPGNTPGLVVPNLGYNRHAPNDAYVDQENNVVASRWTFTDGAMSGINFGKVASGTALHMGMQFVGEDRAGNVTGLTLNEGDALDPLHVWWMTRVQTALLPNLDGEEVGVLPFSWHIDRATALEPEAQDLEARPRFIYRLWFSDGFSDIYTPMNPPYDVWSAWTHETRLADAAPNLADTLRRNGYGDKWILMVVLGADEAGNYELWPSADLTLSGAQEVEAIDRTRKNWMRFKLSSGELDTTVVHELWHNGDTPGSYETLRVADGDINFGAAATVTRPDPSTTLRVEALFRIGVVLPASLEGKDIAVRWSLRRENFAVASGVLPLHPDY
ncbi:MAG TPA: IPT/TIG domain-containing protein, partial [Candidatus Hydrogenedentes bacterium]|nr:IPT/TIG domain-containing protein [Candidatus Hydrogenedentota bacterium]